MGGGSSKGRVLKTQEPQGLPVPEEPPYPGPMVEYHIINTEVSMKADVSIWTAKNMVTTNVDSYYPILGQKYAEGYRLLSFYRVPGMVQTQGGFSMDVSLMYQGVFCRYPDTARNEGRQLQVVKSVMTAQRMGHSLIQANSQVVSDTSHIYQAILDNTRTGGRLICIQMTGQQQGVGVGAVLQGLSPILGVDIFFDMPTTLDPDVFIYQSVPCPVSIEMQIPAGTTCMCDWQGVLDYQLSKGWRLVEIFFNMAAVQLGSGLRDLQMGRSISSPKMAAGFHANAALNSVWFFEKTASKLHDSTPIFEGRVVPHYIEISAGFGGAGLGGAGLRGAGLMGAGLGMGGTRTSMTWHPVIQQMGKNGWEFTCFVETPETRITGTMKVEMKILLFFQRPILPPLDAPPEILKSSSSTPSAPPPPYPGGPSAPTTEQLYGEESSVEKQTLK